MFGWRRWRRSWFVPVALTAWRKRKRAPLPGGSFGVTDGPERYFLAAGAGFASLKRLITVSVTSMASDA